MKKIFWLLVLLLLFFVLVNPIFADTDNKARGISIKAESRTILERIFSRSPVGKFKKFAEQHRGDIEGLREIEFSSRPTDPILRPRYEKISGRFLKLGCYEPKTKKIWINKRLADKKDIVHEIGHHIWHQKLTEEHRAQWLKWFNEEKSLCFSIIARRNEKELFAEHYRRFRLDKEYSKLFSQQHQFFMDLLEKN